MTPLNSNKSIKPVSSISYVVKAFHIIGKICSVVKFCGKMFLSNLKFSCSTKADTKHKLSRLASSVSAVIGSTCGLKDFDVKEKSLASGGASNSRE